MHPYEHALSSANKYGGDPLSYLPIHEWFDATKAYMPDFRHRALRHHSLGIFEAEAVFGVTITNSAGKQIPTRYLGEQHVFEDCGRIPTPKDWLETIQPEEWMHRKGKLLAPEKKEVSDVGRS